MEQILEDYKRKLNTVIEMLNADTITPETTQRLTVKKGMIANFIVEIERAMARKPDASENTLPISYLSGSLRFSEREVDFAYLCGIFNTSGIDGLHNEIQRLKELGKEPHDIIEACRKQ